MERVSDRSPRRSGQSALVLGDGEATPATAFIPEKEIRVNVSGLIGSDGQETCLFVRMVIPRQPKGVVGFHARMLPHCGYTRPPDGWGF